VPQIGKISFGVDPLDSTVTLKPVRISLDPIETRIAITAIPSVRAHLPVNYSVCFSVLGIELAAIRLCGEGMVITEPYRPSPCEVCGPERAALTDVTPVTTNRPSGG
jgi:hypothetical protein